MANNAECLFGLELGMWPSPGAQLRVVAERAVFFVGDVPGLERIPDYSSDEETEIQANLVAWNSAFVPVYAVFLDGAPLG
ncbi:hypothetical protein [Phytoactinopolyspora mesophila]|uniref:Uncharacterized protein n=1 Tax=Phytoactinopolyspora mesophila TaxID=2650750 RepID=A0A7K3M146_9ACTN|nr:hypothetical protein [Phytoactinopolyspora mesophila]NDL56994.1 hypothetical protein [Phytoactinopolyspora mesophila]